MGEYATFRGESVKIGTCEDMYYLRHEHRHMVTPERGNVDPVAGVCGLRFRFPWPDEDATAEPGRDDDGHRYDRSVAVDLDLSSATFEHYAVQFVAHAGYVTSLPCPESPEGARLPFTIHRNGFSGRYHLCQQKQLMDGRLVPIMKCGGCGAKFRLEDPAMIEAVVVALRAEADRLQRLWRMHPQFDGSTDGAATWYHTVADRVAAGARRELVTLAGEDR